MIVSTFAFADLFISEYAEGSGTGNKWLEIYNPTENDVDLSGYLLGNTSNAPTAAGEPEYFTSLTGATLGSGEVYVICHGSYSDQGVCDQNHSQLSNGDDGYCLLSGSETDYEILDCVGDWNADPGTGWPVCDDSNGTKDHTLIRIASVATGNADWTVSSAASTCEWIVEDQNYNADLGDHTCDAPAVDPGDLCADITCPAASGDCYVSGTCDSSTGSCSDETVIDAGTSCDDGNADTVGDACDGAGACAGTALTTSSYDWSNNGTVLGTYGNVSLAENINGELFLTEGPTLSGTPYGVIATVTGLSGGEVVTACADFLAAEDSNDLTIYNKGKLGFHYYQPSLGLDDYQGSAQQSGDYADTPGAWVNLCHTKTMADFVDADGDCGGDTDGDGYDDYDCPDGENDKGGLVIEARLYTYGGSIALGVDNLTVSVTSGTVSFPSAVADVDCDGYWDVTPSAADCTDACGTLAANWVETVAQSGNGAACDNTSPPTHDCAPGEGACPAFDFCDGVTCPDASGDCYVSGTCDSSTGSCSDESAADAGTLCDDGNVDTVGDECDGAGTCAGTIPPSAANLFFSEAAEGTSNNKYLEIYNASNAEVSLSGYAYPAVSNAPTTPGEHEYWNTFSDGAVVAAGDVYVVCHGSADAFITAECDETYTYLSNGDDGLCLAFGSEANYQVLDCVGDFNGDPGSGWSVAGVADATKEHTIVRKGSVTTGNDGAWASSAGTDVDDSEWVVLDQNTWTFIGSHPHDFASTCAEADACNYGDTADCTYAQDGYNCDGNALIDVTFQVNMSEQTVDTEGYGIQLYMANPYGYHSMSDEDIDGVWSVTLTLVEGGTYEYNFKNGADWETVDNLDCAVQSGDYWRRSLTVGNADSALDVVCFGSCSDCVAECSAGDVNTDGILNVLDVVIVVGFILENATHDECADYNDDGTVNVLDVVAMVNIIVGNRISDATEAGLIKIGNSLSLNADGYIGGVQMTLSHGANFSIQLTDKAMVSDYRTNGDETTLIIIAPESDELFIANGEYDIVDMIVANSLGQMDVSVVPNSFILSQAFPNPFNPSTTINLHLENDGLVKVSVFNLAGKEVVQLTNQFVEAGVHSMTWDANDNPSGVYLIRAEMNGAASVQKVILLK